MARFIPTVPESFNGSYGEKEVFKSLRLLDNNYTVFHSLSWIGFNRSIQGEADFVIVHPQKGIMVIEVKGGEIEHKDGRWIQTNTSTREAKKISPIVQAKKSQYDILDRLNAGLHSGRAPLVCHAVWFPSIIIKATEHLPPDAPREIVFDQNSLNHVKEAIDHAFDFWMAKTRVFTNMDSRAFYEVIEILSPHFHVVPGMKSIINEAEQTYIRLTNQQAALLEYLQEQKTAVIHGLAGTGKTVLAKEKAKMLAAGGGNVLFLCFNAFLKDYLRKQFAQPGITFHNVHSLAMEILDSKTDIEGLVEELEEFLIHVIEPEDWPYEHIVIDEGQDINERMVNRLYELSVAKGGTFYVFYDRNQYIMKNEMPQWVERAECRLVLNRNCRNSVEIAKTACSMIAADINIYEDSVHGEKPVGTFIQSKEDLVRLAEKFVKKAQESGIEPEEIVLLTVETESKSLFAGITKVNGIPVANEKTDGCLLFTTVRKFKGLEAKAVMLVDVSIKMLTNPEKQRLVYVGGSRARHLLKIAVMDDLDPTAYGEYLKKINAQRNVPRNKKGFGRLLNMEIEA